eukprot:1177572-Prorocentrum_minimum.AAC.3
MADRMMRVTPSKKPDYYWHEPGVLEAELLPFVEAAGGGRLPRTAELLRAKRADLVGAVQLAGGLDQVRKPTMIYV